MRAGFGFGKVVSVLDKFEGGKWRVNEVDFLSSVQTGSPTEPYSQAKYCRLWVWLDGIVEGSHNDGNRGISYQFGFGPNVLALVYFGGFRLSERNWRTNNASKELDQISGFTLIYTMWHGPCVTYGTKALKLLLPGYLESLILIYGVYLKITG